MPIIKIENLGKKYLIRHVKNRRYIALRDVIADKIKFAGNRMRHPFSATAGNDPSREEFWALQDVSFEINQGERVGIIGRNGAGKSTLLKIMSRITDPTKGKISLKGRVASLLEVGTGFHPELTGRENIFLNGAILGMARTEIKSKFDEIVAFAEVEKFLDTPVKRYSSGMYVRLAFAVAAHLEPEILIVDEVLAVGDVQFQKKCLGKMDDVAKNGKTVIFVSHNMAALENLCNRGIVLEKGIITYQGSAIDSINYYLNSFVKKDELDIEQRKDRSGEGNVRMTGVEIVNNRGEKNIPFPIGENLHFSISYKAKACPKNMRVVIGVYDSMNAGIARFDTAITGGLPLALPESGTITCSTEPANLSPGRYFINIAVFSNGVMEDYIPAVSYLDVIGSDFFNSGKLFNEIDIRLTKVMLRHEWTHADLQ